MHRAYGIGGVCSSPPHNFRLGLKVLDLQGQLIALILATGGSGGVGTNIAVLFCWFNDEVLWILWVML